MNKSTPLSELPNIKRGENSNAYEEKENQIVSEILSEIDNNSSKENVSMNIEEPQENTEMIEQQRVLEEQQRMIQQESAAISQESANRRLEESLNNSVNDNMVSNIINIVKQPLIVAVVIAVISIPRVGEMLSSILAGREKLAPYSAIIIMLVKALVGASMFYGINMNV